MRSVLLAAIAALGTLAMDVPAQAQSYHNRYYQERTPKGDSFSCESARSESSLKDTLESAGWPSDKAMPRIDWATEEAVIVAPPTFHQRSELAFFGLIREGGGFVLKYGWLSWPESTVVCQSDNICSSSQGLHEDPTFETMVIAYPRDMDAGLSFKCRNVGVDP